MTFNLKSLAIELYFLLILAVLIFVARGYVGNPSSKDLNTRYWKEDGVFELSPERGRFGLLYSLVEDKSFSYSIDVARFSTPDVGFVDGKYVSLFAPGLSFLVIPGYVFGSMFNASQLGAFVVIGIIAIFNCLLLFKISIIITKRLVPSLIPPVVFLFATPAFAYSVNLYQHHATTFILLLSIFLYIKYNNWLSSFIIFMLCAFSIPLDYPNLFIMLPVGLYTAARMFSLNLQGSQLKASINFLRGLSIIGIIPALLFFLWFNFKSYNNPLQFSGTIASVKELDENGKPTVPSGQSLETVSEFVSTKEQKKDAARFFDPRDSLDGSYTLLFSPDRGVLYYTPIMFLGVVGLYLMVKSSKHIASLFIFISAITVLIYSMWGDPWGGWAFGSRYLIPIYSILSLGVGYTVLKLNKNILFVVIFCLLFSYSVFVNTAGALGTIASPPKVEVLFLESLTKTVQKYTYERSFDLIKEGNTKSIIYNRLLKDRVSLINYYIIIGTLCSSLGLLPVILGFVIRKKYESS